MVGVVGGRRSEKMQVNANKRILHGYIAVAAVCQGAPTCGVRCLSGFLLMPGKYNFLKCGHITVSSDRLFSDFRLSAMAISHRSKLQVRHIFLILLPSARVRCLILQLISYFLPSSFSSHTCSASVVFAYWRSFMDNLCSLHLFLNALPVEPT